MNDDCGLVAADVWFYECNVALARVGFELLPPSEYAHRVADLLSVPLTLQ